MFNTYAMPQAVLEFGYTRGQVIYNFYISTSPQSYYLQSTDQIYIYSADDVWKNYGDFTIMHEFGHAYHQGAIEAFGTETCGPSNKHYLDSLYTTSCAYIEGFADFFSVYLLRNDPGQNYFSPMTAEAASYPKNRQNLLSERAMASLFWDMMDGGSSGITDFDSTGVDSVTMTPYELARDIRECQLHGPNWTSLLGSDQLIYCMEGTVNNARYAAPSSPMNYQTAWGVYSAALSWDYGSPFALPNTTKFRTLWFFDFYGP